ncbi:MAG: alpha/beta hydrolase [Chloroflexota bacterium]
MISGTAVHDNIKTYYEALGDPSNETIIFISGLGSQLVYWTDELCQVFIDRGFHTVRFDNRDTGWSHKTLGEPPSIADLMSGADFEPPYTLSDMATDTISVLDDLGIDTAHVVGTSLGGMIAQTVAIEHPQRVKSLTSIMSAPSRTTAVESEETRDDAVAKSVSVDVSDPDSYVDLQVEGYRVTSGPHFDPVYQQKIIQRSFDRCYHPAGWSYQMLAATASGDRTEKLGSLTMPTLIIHGALDPLIPVSGGEKTANAIPHAKLLIIDDMGHNLPRPRWAEIADAIATNARQAE